MAWLKFFESAGNHLLSFDPDFLEQLRPFFGKTFRFELTEPVYSFDLRPCPDGFIIEPTELHTLAEVTLTGSAWAFARLGREGPHSEVFAKGSISMHGDAELGQAFQRTLGALQIDWEELIATLAGDAAARSLGRLYSGLEHWLGQSGRHFKENSSDYIQQELRLSPSRVEVDALAEEIETLRADTARLEARIRRLQTDTEG